MAIKITISNTVTIKVKGSINSAEGKAEPFSFNLVCDRLAQDEITTFIADRGDSPIADFVVHVTKGWSDVKADDGSPITFSEASLRDLLRIPGLPALAYRTYLAEVGAKEKN